MNFRVLCIIAVLGGFMLFFYDGCGTPVQYKTIGTNSTEITNPMTPATTQISTALCSVLNRCNPQASLASCEAGFLSASTSGQLGTPLSYATFQSVLTGEQTGQLSANQSALNSCVSAIDNLSCGDPTVQGAYNPAASNPFSAISNMIPTQSSSSCMNVFQAPPAWRTSYLVSNAQGPLSALPYNKYSNLFLLGATCVGTAVKDDPTWVNTSDWPSLISSAHAAGAKVSLVLETDLTACTTPSTIDSFVTGIANLLSGNDPVNNPAGIVFDGVDLDWLRNVDGQTAAYQSLIQKLRAKLGPNKTISLSVYPSTTFTSLVHQSFSSLDQVNVMCYDMWQGQNAQGQAWSWYNAAIHSPTPNSASCDANINSFQSTGVPPSKLGVQIPFYGYLFSGCTSSEVVGCSTTPTEYNYNRIVTNTSWWNGGANKHFDSVNLSSYLSISATNQFVTYSDTDYIQALTNWGHALGLGGYATWTLGAEYISTATGDAQFPLSSALYQATSNSH